MNETFFLCHKCHGNLSKANAALRGCGCMSGWVRDWQAPVDLETAEAAQVQGAEYPREGYASWVKPLK